MIRDMKNVMHMPSILALAARDAMHGVKAKGGREQARPWPWTPTRALRLSSVFSRSRLRFVGGCGAAFAFGYGAPMLYAYWVGRLCPLCY